MSPEEVVIFNETKLKNKQNIHSVFVAGQKKTYDGNFAIYKESVIYGKRIVLGSKFFDLQQSDFGQHPVYEQIQTILHEAHHAAGLMDEYDVEQQSVKFSYLLKETEAYKQFIAEGGVYTIFMNERKSEQNQ
jgi:hypothetical protein